MRFDYEISEFYFPQKILESYQTFSKTYSEKNWEKVREESMWNELCFCVLSANVFYDNAKSAFHILRKKGYLNAKWIKEERKARTIIRKQLQQSTFLPRKINGELRKYRYPDRRSKQIVDAAKILYSRNNSIKKLLKKSKSELKLRLYLVKKIPGLGIKEASHFLRNIGFSKSLAIIDVHVRSFLERMTLVDFLKKGALTEKVYLILEKILRNLARFHKLKLSVLDMAIWYCVKHSIV